eukprot:CAMPEP_0184502874 /NCGR_PEP_ID=MMETSP0113_2-20130426/51441_1 /TAXON_ID=91329 /ORGANISM="Norrisiella sphaerica, Strain BC52" /LENGTH=1207 /DNA_ID=CAMNT_0026892237 /DNA_START=206 /DNA_END=3829 /DNA_ORIENTATION=+
MEEFKEKWSSCKNSIVYIAEVDGKVAWVADSITSLAGYTPEEFMSKNGMHYIVELTAILKRVIQHGSYVFNAYRFKMKNGETLPVMVHSELLDDRWHIILTPVPKDFMDSEFSLITKKYASKILHALNTPLTGLEAQIGLLKNTMCSDDHAVRNIIQSMEIQLSLMKARVRSSASYGKKLSLTDTTISEFNWNDLVKSVDEMMSCHSRSWSGSNVELSTVIDSNLQKLTFNGSVEWLKDIIFHLRSNAYKVITRGTIQTIIREEIADAKAGEKTKCISIEVRDTGRGFRHEDAFELQSTISHLKESSHDMGLHLGLFHVKSIAEAMSGEAYARPNEGGGSIVGVKFRLDLTCKREEKEGNEKVTKGKVVLLAEDHLSTLKSIQRLLTNRGHTVLAARNGALGINLLHKAVNEGKEIDIVLTDLNMPIKDGFQLAKAALEEPSFHGIIIGMSASRPEHLENTALDFFFPKPLKLKHFTWIATQPPDSERIMRKCSDNKSNSQKPLSPKDNWFLLDMAGQKIGPMNIPALIRFRSLIGPNADNLIIFNPDLTKPVFMRHAEWFLKYQEELPSRLVSMMETEVSMKLKDDEKDKPVGSKRKIQGKLNAETASQIAENSDPAHKRRRMERSSKAEKRTKKQVIQIAQRQDVHPTPKVPMINEANASGPLPNDRTASADAEEVRLDYEKYDILFEMISKCTLPVFVCDQIGKLIMINDSHVEMFGYSRNDLIGKDNSVLLADDGADPMRVKNMHKAIQAGGKGQFVVACTTKDGTRLDTNMAAVQVGTLTINFVQSVKGAYTLEEIQDAAKRSAQLLDVKNQIDVFAHDVRTPLHSLVNLWPDVKRRLGTALHSDRDLKATVQDMEASMQGLLGVVVNQLGIAKQFFGRSKVLILEHLKKIKSMLKSTCGKFLKFDFKAPTNTEVPTADGIAIFQIISNLVNNARVVHPKGLVVVRVTVTENELLIIVKDSGDGMPGDLVDFLTDRTDVVPTKGLGIKIVKKLVKSMNGNIHYKYDSGSCLTVTGFLSHVVHTGESTMENAERKAPEPNASSDDDVEDLHFDLKVLCVDDAPMNLKLLHRMLKSNCKQVETISFAKDAVVMTTQKHFDVVCMDFGMPKGQISGIEASRRMRSRGFNGFIMGVSGCSEEVAGDAVQSGVVDLVVTKPYNKMEILKAFKTKVLPLLKSRREAKPRSEAIVTSSGLHRSDLEQAR